jgi:hypothetical protein
MLSPQDRVYCRECRARLPREDGMAGQTGFCCRGCWERWHRKHCGARGCGKEMPRKIAGLIIQYCSRRCRNASLRFPPFLWPKAPPPYSGSESVGLGAENADGMGTFLPLNSGRAPSRSSRRVWVRQADEWMWIEHDGTVLARIYRAGDRWKIRVPGVRIIAGPPELMQGFITAEKAKSEAVSIHFAGAVVDRETQAKLRRETVALERDLKRGASIDEFNRHTRAGTETWTRSFDAPAQYVKQQPEKPPLSGWPDVPAFLDRHLQARNIQKCSGAVDLNRVAAGLLDQTAIPALPTVFPAFLEPAVASTTLGVAP